ncbi:MAG: universal stress protein [bacterium]
MKATKILIAIDEPTLAKHIIESTFSIINKEKAEISLIKITHLSIADEEIYNTAPELYIEHECKQGNIKELENYIINEGYKYKELITKEGNAADEIIKTVNSGNYDLIVVGSHNKGNLERFLLGSVSQKVSLHSKASVLIVKNLNIEKKLTANKEFKVLFAVDNSEFHNKMIEKITDILDLKRARFSVINVTPDIYSTIPADAFIYSDIERIKDAIDNAAKETINKVALNLMKRHANIDKKYHIEGDAAETIIEEAKKENVDLTVVGSRGKTAFSGWLLGSVSSKTSAYSDKTILILKK